MTAYQILIPNLDNPNYYIAALPLCADCNKKLLLRKTEFRGQSRGTCPECQKEYIVNKETRFHMRRV